MARHGVSAAERRRIAAELERLSRASEAEVKRIVASLYARIRDLPPEQALRVLREAMPQAAEAAAAAIGERYVTAAVAGGRSAVSRLGLSTAGGFTETGWLAAARASEAGGLTIRQLGGQMGRDFLSPHLHRQGAEMVRKMEGAFGQIIREGESAMELARRMRDVEGQRIWVKTPKVVEEFEAAARRMVQASGDPRALEEWGRQRARYKRYISKLSDTAGEYGLRAAHEQALAQLEAAVQSGQMRAIEQAKKWLAYDQQAYRQRVIARTQIGRAYTEGFVQNADVPWVVGFQWNVESGGGRKRDICDVYGNQDLYGLGAGIYPFDKVPGLPAHPNCNCYLTEHIDDDVDEEDGRPPPPPQRANADAAWLKSQPAEVQREILGTGRYREFVSSGRRSVPSSPMFRMPEPTLRPAMRGPSYEEASRR